MAKVVFNTQDKAEMLCDFYREVYVIHEKAGTHADTCDYLARRAVDNFQIFIDGRIEDYASKDMVVDEDDDSIPFQEQERPSE